MKNSDEIDLGRKVSDLTTPMGASASRKGKSRVIYPTLYIDGVEGLEDLPKDFCAVVRCHRLELSVRDDENGDEKTGAQLEVRSLKLCDDQDGGGLEDAFAKLKPGEVADDSGYDYSEDEDEDEE